MAQLVSIGIEHPDIKFEVVYGISDNQRTWFDNANALRLGYRPQDKSEDYAEDVLKRSLPPGNAPADIFQGGGHCMAEGGTRSVLAGEAPAKKTAKAAKATKRTSRSVKLNPAKKAVKRPAKTSKRPSPPAKRRSTR